MSENNNPNASAAATTSEPVVSHNEAKSRYEIKVGDKLAGLAEYTLGDGLVAFTHTETDPAFEGRGLATQLVKYALDDVKAKGERKILPVCPFVVSYVRKHPDYPLY